MTVVAGYFCGRLYKELPSLKELPREAGEEIALNAALNSKVCLLGWV
jgi:Ca2+-transporting ATPase